jgi:hypothetical protein
VPTPEVLSTEQYEDDDPPSRRCPTARIAVAWVAYAGEADRVLLRERRDGRWSEASEATPRDRRSLPLLARGRRRRRAVGVLERAQRETTWTCGDGGARARQGGASAIRCASAAADRSSSIARRRATGTIVRRLAELFRADAARPTSDIWLRELEGGRVERAVRVSESPKSDWEPALAAGPRRQRLRRVGTPTTAATTT